MKFRIDIQLGVEADDPDQAWSQVKPSNGTLVAFSVRPLQDSPQPNQRPLQSPALAARQATPSAS